MDILINIDVPDLESGAAFYLAAFDLRIGRRIGSDVIELLGATAPIYLLAKPAGTAATLSWKTPRSYGRHWTPVHLDMVVPDIEAALRRALAAGAVQEAPVSTAAWGKLALMADPFGNGFCLVQFLGRGYDEIATRESC